MRRNQCLHFGLIYLLFFFLLFIFSFSNSVASLSATTWNKIQGNSPRLSLEIENAINLQHDFKYFGITYQGQNYFSQSDFDKVLTAVSLLNVKPIDFDLSPTIAMLQANDAKDEDGDSIEGIKEKETGSVTLDWYYRRDNHEIKLVDYKDKTFCELALIGIKPYIKVQGDIVLTTQFGSPNYQYYPDENIAVTYQPQRYFSLPFTSICYASPNLNYKDNGDESHFFVSSAGFIPENDFTKNFPSTGANNLYFYLVVSGLDLANTNWYVESTDNSDTPIAVTVENSVTKDSTGFVKFMKETMVLVKLSGPDIDNIDIGAKADVANLPVKISLTGNDDQGSSVNYQFQIKKWFINRKNKKDYPAKQDTWCQSLSENDSYRMPTVSDLTNANSALWTAGTSSNSYHQRKVDGSLFSEWGNMTTYSGAKFYSSIYYWTDNIIGSNVLNVSAQNGDVNKGSNERGNAYGICVNSL